MSWRQEQGHTGEALREGSTERSLAQPVSGNQWSTATNMRAAPRHVGHGHRHLHLPFPLSAYLHVVSGMLPEQGCPHLQQDKGQQAACRGRKGSGPLTQTHSPLGLPHQDGDLQPSRQSRHSGSRGAHLTKPSPPHAVEVSHPWFPRGQVGGHC